MARRYGSFVVRYWRLSGDERRIEIEHVQSGDRTRVASLADGAAWIDARLDRPPGQKPVQPARPDPFAEEVTEQE